MTDIILGVSGVALQDEKILLARRGRSPYRGMWSLPGGKVKPFEPHREALVREFGEETGLVVSVGRLAGIAEAIRAEHGSHYLILSYFVTVEGGVLRAGDDAVEVRWFSRRQLRDLELTPTLERYLEQFGAWRRQL
ncbi:MAG TPA: NUDIX domain-containing protein [Actinomycetota bacterium]|nr:NUDIX domain-containing protein [Actinomycetota bacterium]